MKTTKAMAEQIEITHNVYVDVDGDQYNIGGGYDAEHGWTPIPLSWKIQALEQLSEARKDGGA